MKPEFSIWREHHNGQNWHHCDPHAIIMDDWRSSVVREIGLFWETGTLFRLRFCRNLLNEIKGIGTGGDFWKEFCHHLRNSDDDGTHVEWEGDEEAGGGQKKSRKIHKP